MGFGFLIILSQSFEQLQRWSVFIRNRPDARITLVAAGVFTVQFQLGVYIGDPVLAEAGVGKCWADAH